VSRALLCMWALALTCSTGVLAWSGVRYGSARAAAASGLARFAAVSAQCSEAARLRRSAPAWALHGRVSGLTPRISAALATSGLPASALASVSPEAESPVGDADLRARRSRAVVTLAPITLAQLGGFLAAWRTREPQWTVSSIDVAPQNGGARQEMAGGDLPLRAVIGIETLFVDQGGGH
jgi:hypothetical protein